MIVLLLNLRCRLKCSWLMNDLLGNLQLRVPEKLYVKDPESSDLGKRILAHSIDLIDALGFEAFTFKKLGQRIGSPESTIYRYFENKHTLLLYLSSWYWAWLEYRVAFAAANVEDPEQRLRNTLQVITAQVEPDGNFGHIDEKKLQNILISESSKAFLTKEVDAENKKGFFQSYKSLCERIVNIIREIQPDFAFAHSLVTTVLEGSHQQRFFGQHLPGITDVGHNQESVQAFFENLTFSMLKNGR